MTNQDKYSSFLDSCECTGNTRTVILTSSRANPNAVPDTLSDYDIELYVNDLAPFSEDDAWIEAFGSILIRWPLKPAATWSSEWLTRLIQFEDGIRFDLQITHKKPEYHGPFDAGYKILIDKDRLGTSIAPARFENLLIKKPSQEEFNDRINAFLWDILYAAKSLKRNELFYAKFMMDSVIRFNSLQVFIEWYIGATHNWDVSTNKCGRWFKRYLSSNIWKHVESTFAGAQIEDNWQTIFAAIDLVRLLCDTICDVTHCIYPLDQEKRVSAYIDKIRTS